MEGWILFKRRSDGLWFNYFNLTMNFVDGSIRWVQITATTLFTDYLDGFFFRCKMLHHYNGWNITRDYKKKMFRQKIVTNLWHPFHLFIAKSTAIIVFIQPALWSNINLISKFFSCCNAYCTVQYVELSKK